MQSVSSRIWIRVDVSISYDDNHYSTGISKSVIYVYINPPAHEQDGTEGQLFWAVFNGFTFRVPALLFTHNWRENNWMHTFPKNIRTKRNSNSSRIRTQIAVSISYGYDYYTTSAS